MNADKARRSLVITNFVIAEVHELLLFRHRDPALALRLARGVLAADRLALHYATAAHHARALEHLEQLRAHRISYEDAVSFAVMESLGLDIVLGFDADFRLAGFQLAGDALDT